MTYKMIIVDDEMLAIEGVMADLDLENLRISELFVAITLKHAKEIFNQESIDILLCDIEMPQGSGLELLAWVKEHSPQTETIIFTSHADFKYAKEAMSLGSLDYLLKPVLQNDLENVIKKAQDVIDRNSEMNRNSQSHHLWMTNQSLIIERFWMDLINHTIPSNPAGINERIERHQIPIAEKTVFLPVLLSVQRWNKELDGRGEKILEYALKNSAEEIYLNKRNGILFYIDRGKLLAIFTSEMNNSDWDQKNLEELSAQYIDSCNQYFYCDISCYFGKPVEAHEMAATVAHLKERDRNNVAFYNNVYLYDEERLTGSPIELPALNIWMSLLKAGKKEPVIQEVEKYVVDLVQNHNIDIKTLHQLHHDIMQTLYSFLNSKGIQAHQLFEDEESISLSEKAGRSVADLLTWIHHAISKVLIQADVVQESDSVIETIKRYISNHIDQDLSRESIAEMVYLHPDYLSRLFKKETGTSITDYISTNRINMAKELLRQTNIPISTISLSVGYTNFSHFGRTFKKYTGLGPMEYRSQYASSKM